ncbi:hypothetical protein H9P43_000121 [Blastocladiella emersonii ATCC 22665]|nr:hypothetical protein H9P43_000121 [Blastocladiella emersonii ATCC 22665]
MTVISTALLSDLAEWVSDLPLADAYHGLAAKAADLIPATMASPHLSPTATVATAAGAVTVAAATTLYLQHLRVPSAMRHLPVVRPLDLVRLLASGKSLLDVCRAEIELARADAVRRGIDLGAAGMPKVWASWLFGTWTVIVANPADMKLILTQHDALDKAYFSVNEELVGYENIVLSRKHEWKRFRKIMNPAFRMGWSTSLFGDLVRVMLADFDNHAASGAPVDVACYMQRMTLDALSVGAFGTSLDSLAHPDGDLVVTYNRIMEVIADPIYMTVPGLKLVSPTYRAFRGDIVKFNQHIFDLIDAKTRRAADEGFASQDSDVDRRDLLQRMIDASATGTDDALTRDELRINTIVFFIAGHDTTSAALTFALYLLGTHPAVQAKARTEVLAVLGSSTSGACAAADAAYPDNDQVAQLPYLTAVIKETLRVYPSVPLIPPRETMRDVVLSDGTVLPRGTRVAGHLCTVHADAGIWGDDSAEFKPERFLVGGDEGKVPSTHPGAHDFAWAPFGGGQRVCLGQGFSIMEQRVVLASMLARYEWTVAGEAGAKPDIKPGVLLQPRGIKIVLKRRM